MIKNRLILTFYITLLNFSCSFYGDTNKLANIYNKSAISLPKVDSTSNPLDVYPQLFAKHISGREYSPLMEGDTFSTQLNNPEDLVIDHEGNFFVADTDNLVIRKIDKSGQISNFIGTGKLADINGAGNQKDLYPPIRLSFDSNGNLFILEKGFHQIRKITPDGSIERIAGSGKEGYKDGKGEFAQFGNLTDMAIDSKNNIFVTDITNNVVRKISPEGIVSTFPEIIEKNYGNGKPKNYPFKSPSSIAINKNDEVFVFDDSYYQIFKIDSLGNVFPFVGNGEEGFVDGLGVNSKITGIRKMKFSTDGFLYFLDLNGIRKVSNNGNLKSLVTKFYSNSMVFDKNNQIYFVNKYSGLIYSIENDNFEKIFAGVSPITFDFPKFGKSTELYFKHTPNVILDFKSQLIIFDHQKIMKIDSNNNFTKIIQINKENKIKYISNVFIDEENNYYISDSDAGKVFVLSENQKISPLPFQFDKPFKIIKDDFGNLYILEKDKHHILKVNRNNQLVKFAGSANIKGYKNGIIGKDEILFDSPSDFSLDSNNNLIIVDYGNKILRKISLKGEVTTVSGFMDLKVNSTMTHRTENLFTQPENIFIDKDNNIFVSDLGDLYVINNNNGHVKKFYFITYPYIPGLIRFKSFVTNNLSEGKLIASIESLYSIECIEKRVDCNELKSYQFSTPNSRSIDSIASAIDFREYVFEFQIIDN